MMPLDRNKFKTKNNNNNYKQPQNHIKSTSDSLSTDSKATQSLSHIMQNALRNM